MTRRNRHFLTDAAIYGIGGIVIQLASVALLPLYTHYLSPADYGVMEVIERIGEIINICLMTTGVRQAAFAFYLQSSTEADREQVAVTISSFVLAIFLLASAAILVTSPVLAPCLGIANGWLLVFGVVAVLTELFLVVPLCLMQARVESISFAIVSVVMLLLRIGMAIVFVAGFGWGLWGVYASLLMSFTPFGVILSWREIRRGSLKLNWEQGKQITRFSLPFIPAGLCFFVLYNGDRFFLVGSAGPAALGIYALGCKIASIAGTVSWQPLFRVWSARMYKTFEEPGAEYVAGQMLTRLLTAYAFVATGLGLFHREALSILSSHAYADAGPVIGPMLLANAFMLISTFMEVVFYVWRKTHWKPWTSLVGMTVIVALYAVLIPRYSIFGAVYASLIGYAAMAFVTFVVAQRVFAVRYEWTKILVLAGLSAGVYYVGTLLELGIVPFFLKCALMLGWLAALCLAGIISADDRSTVLSLVGRVASWLQTRPSSADTAVLPEPVALEECVPAAVVSQPGPEA